MKEFIIDIELDGSMRIEGKGFEGPECKAFSKEIEEAVGEVTSVVEKPEFRRARTNVRKVTV